jgi:beta-galactosidase
MKKLILLLLLSYNSIAQTINGIVPAPVLSELKMGDVGPVGKELRVNNLYLTLGGKPFIPVMGEVHFSRVPRAQWEDVILKMKANGINIIACYVLWMHHEEIEGQFDWSGNKDLRAFVKLCQQHGMWVYPRIGPWCHAEVRNGGTPDWLLLKRYVVDRSMDPVYQHYAEDWYAHIAGQLRGLLYKDGGPVIGIQLENEYGRGKSGEAYIRWLKQTALKYGMDVPLYTVTGWQNGSVPANEVIPLWGAYPDEPWGDHLNRNTNCVNFRFTPLRDNEHIGNNVKQGKDSYFDYSAYPYFTCEVGLGIENTEHRRLKIGALDGKAIIMAKLGSGSNLAGYYMFAGGSNPHGVLTSLEENKSETGYWNTNPVVSYDFQAPIRESGLLNDCYHEVKTLHYFLHEFGDRLAPMVPVFSGDYTLRVKGNAGFLFGVNYCRNNVSSDKNNAQFKIKLAGETISFPAVNIGDSSIFVWPFNFPMGDDVLLKYATAQPLCHIGNVWVFMQDTKVVPEFCFEVGGEKKIVSGLELMNNLVPGFEPFTVGTQKVIILSASAAKHAWFFEEDGRKRLFVSAANLYMKDGQLHAFDTVNHFTVSMLNEEGIFVEKKYSLPEQKIPVTVHRTSVFEDAKWLQTNYVAKNNLYHRFFVKEFSLGNPAGIKAAYLYLYGKCGVQVNNRWVNQTGINQLSINKASIGQTGISQLSINQTSIGQAGLYKLDITGYVQKNENTILLDFPADSVKGVFAAKIDVEYLNADKVSFVTDESWLMKDGYTYPTFLKPTEGLTAPIFGEAVGSFSSADVNYKLEIADSSHGYLAIHYTGDKARLYYNQQLAGDDFNNGTGWTMGLNRLEGRSFRLEITPLLSPSGVYFDDEAAKQQAVNAILQSVKIIPEYHVVIPLM